MQRVGYTTWMCRRPSGAALQISTDVLAKIARLAALEVGGVAEVTTGGQPECPRPAGPYRLCRSRSAWLLEDGIATVTVHPTAVLRQQESCRLCEKVQENVKQTIQNMTGITVARVDVLVVGLAEPAAQA